MTNGTALRQRSWLDVRAPLALAFAFGALSLVGCTPAEETGGGTGGAGTGSGGAVASSGGAPSQGSGGAPQGSGGAPQASGGMTGSGGAASGTGGRSNTGGASGATGGAGGRSNTGGATSGSGGRSNTGGTSGATGGAGGGGTLAKFSFFVTSVDALKTLSANPLGFGGDLRFGETGDGAGLKGADKICTTIADTSMPGSGAKGWRAFLSAPAAGSMPVVNAIDRIGNGPWYDRQGRLFSMSKANLIGFRPSDADPSIKNDFPNEYGIPNHTDGAPGCTGNACPDNHDTLTGSNDQGKLYAGDRNPTCDGWTNKTGSAGKPRVGHSWPRSPQTMNTCRMSEALGGCYGHWMSSLDEAGCAPGINLVEMGPPNPNDPTVGSGGGYGGIYCFALMP